MINQIQDAFPNIVENGCLSLVESKHTFVYEHPELKKGVFVNATEKYHLHIENKTNTSFHFIQNDDCVMRNVKGGQCDYVVFNDFSIYFTEIKAKKRIYQ